MIGKIMLKQVTVAEVVVEEAVARFDYNAEAELFPSRNKRSGRRPVGYRRFGHAADAIRFAIEELAPEFLLGAHLEEMRRDMIAEEFVAYTRAQTIP